MDKNDKTISDDAIYLKYAAEYKTLMDSVKRYFVGKTARLVNYNVEINGHTNKIADVQLAKGDIYFLLKDCSLPFGPEHLQILEASDGHK